MSGSIRDLAHTMPLGDKGGEGEENERQRRASMFLLLLKAHILTNQQVGSNCLRVMPPLDQISGLKV